MRVETVGVLRFLHGGCSRKGLDQKPCLNVIFSIRASGSFGLFVGQCVASLETSVMSSSRTPLSQSDVRRSSLVYSCEVFARNASGKCHRTLDHCQAPFSHFGCSSDFLRAYHVSGALPLLRACSFNSTRQRPVHPTFFVESYVTRSSLFLLSVQSSQCESGKCNRVSASCCSCLFNKVL